MQSIITDPGEYADLLNDLPNDIPLLCRIVQGLIIHIYTTELYGVKLSDERLEKWNLRRVSRQIKRILELDNLPLTTTRPPEKKIVGCCRDFALFLTTILRHKGVPARIRAGFAVYFPDYHYGAHYICQYWNTDEMRWVTVDSQIDDVQHKFSHITFNTLDIPKNKFMPGGRAWQMCRGNKADPGEFAIDTLKGMGLIRYKLNLDMLALNKIELTPGDTWKLAQVDAKVGFSSEEEAVFFDKIAAVTEGDEPDFTQVRSLYQNSMELQPEADWKP